MKKKAFTLIELIAVLVILAILALIVTPLVMNIIRKARIAADKRSIDAYGRSIELAIATYLLDNGDFPTSINDLTIEYSGDQVVCSTTQLNSESSVYLTGCTVAGRNVDYTYGRDQAPIAPTYDPYSIGDEVSYNNVDYYVINNSGIDESSVTLLKKTPLTKDEVNLYGGVGTENNHVNMYSCSSSWPFCYQTAYNNSGYGGMSYYTSETCGMINGYGVNTGCTTDYARSDVKYVVDAWTQSNTVLSDLVEDSMGYKSRLITYDELYNNLNYDRPDLNTNTGYPTSNTPSFMINNSFGRYWTMSAIQDYDNQLWVLDGNDGKLSEGYITSHDYAVRPVITIKKSALN